MLHTGDQISGSQFFREPKKQPKNYKKLIINI